MTSIHLRCEWRAHTRAPKISSRSPSATPVGLSRDKHTGDKTTSPFHPSFSSMRISTGFCLRRYFGSRRCTRSGPVRFTALPPAADGHCVWIGYHGVPKPHNLTRFPWVIPYGRCTRIAHIRDHRQHIGPPRLAPHVTKKFAWRSLTARSPVGESLSIPNSSIMRPAGSPWRILEKMQPAPLLPIAASRTPGFVVADTNALEEVQGTGLR